MEAIKNQGYVGAMIFNAGNIGLAHVAAGIFNLLFLIVAEHFVEKMVNSIQAFTLSNPDNAGFIRIVGNGGIFLPLAIGDFGNANGVVFQLF